MLNVKCHNCYISELTKLHGDICIKKINKVDNVTDLVERVFENADGSLYRKLKFYIF